MNGWTVTAQGPTPQTQPEVPMSKPTLYAAAVTLGVIVAALAVTAGRKWS